MKYKKIVEDCITYIEEHLCEEITPKLIADYVCYSPYHFYRIFSETVGMTLTQYITERRLTHAIYEISQGISMLDAAIKYGFESYAGFYKAFRRIFELSPSEYLKKHEVVIPAMYVIEKEYYIMLTKSKIKSLLENWPLEKPYLLEPVYSENSKKRSDQWIVNNDYLLKITRNEAKMIQNHKVFKQ